MLGTVRKITVAVGFLALGSNLTACGLNNQIKAKDKTTQTSAPTEDVGFASFSLADLTSLADIKVVKLSITGTDHKGVPFTKTINQDYATGKSFKAENVPTGTYLLKLEVTDATGKVIATGEAANVVIKSGSETKVNLSLTKADTGGTLVVQVEPGPNTGNPPSAELPKSDQQNQNQGYTMDGKFKTCSKPAPRMICNAIGYNYSAEDAKWMKDCESIGGVRVSCTADACEWPVPSQGTLLCSKQIQYVCNGFDKCGPIEIRVIIPS